MIRLQDVNQFHVRALCEICGFTKAKYLSNRELNQLPDLFKQLPFRVNFLKFVVYNGMKEEIFPILEPILNERRAVC